MPDYNKMSKAQRAAYMREYRARKKAMAEGLRADAQRDLKVSQEWDAISSSSRITELEAEVHRLKQELAKRPLLEPPGAIRYGGQPDPEPRRSRQSFIDAVLRKVNRKTGAKE